MKDVLQKRSKTLTILMTAVISAGGVFALTEQVVAAGEKDVKDGVIDGNNGSGDNKTTTTPTNSNGHSGSGSTIGEASFTSVRNISVKSIQPLSFGAVSPSSTNNGMLVLGTDGSMQSTGGILVLGGHQQGKFRVEGTPNNLVQISVDNQVSLSNGSKVIKFNTKTNANAQVIGSNGTLDFGVGGNLEVEKNQELGTYYGTYNVVVNY